MKYFSINAYSKACMSAVMFLSVGTINNINGMNFLPTYKTRDDIEQQNQHENNSQQNVQRNNSNLNPYAKSFSISKYETAYLNDEVFNSTPDFLNIPSNEEIIFPRNKPAIDYINSNIISDMDSIQMLLSQTNSNKSFILLSKDLFSSISILYVKTAMELYHYRELNFLLRSFYKKTKKIEKFAKDKVSKQIKLHVDSIWHNLSKIFAYALIDYNINCNILNDMFDINDMICSIPEKIFQLTLPILQFNSEVSFQETRTNTAREYVTTGYIVERYIDYYLSQLSGLSRSPCAPLPHIQTF